MIKHVFFDMDGTLTPSRQQISPEMLNALSDLRIARVKEDMSAEYIDIIIVSGARREQMYKQIGGGPWQVLAQNGNEMYDSLGDERPMWRNELTWVQKFKIFNLINHLLIGHPREHREDYVEDRGCQISYSGTGHHARRELKLAYDPDGSYRKEIITSDFGWFGELKYYGIKWAIGGTTCIDFYTHTKGENVARYVAEHGWIPNECLYVGDALFEGGNDATVKGVVPVHQVSGPEETLTVIKSLL